MKKELYTIPLNEALEKDGECLFCTLHEKIEREIIDYILGPSYMEEDIRGETDKKGFCKRHYAMMYKEQNRLGVALMLSTHLKHLRGELDTLIKTEGENRGKKSLFKKDKTPSGTAEYLHEIETGCYACERMENRMKSYVSTFFYLWKREAEFREKIMKSKGFCLEHFEMLLRNARSNMSDDKYTEFFRMIAPLETKNLDILIGDIDWFIQKFDYRFKDEPWKNSEDALPRGILKVSAVNVVTTL